ncbi:hypothetical protein BU15DRAFT_91076 [Melanogaster broomeanus]|nr:hypothetical protein BU15DRAFT_91076 [Melanogaster broomeanus]
MLREKRKRFEVQFEVPEASRLTGDGWIAPFCKAYKIKEYRRHGEAGSVDVEAVAAEQTRVQKILSTFPPKDRFNFDETRLFALCFGNKTPQSCGFHYHNNKKAWMTTELFEE